MDGLEFAIRMEHDGEQYYREQAEINKDNGLKPVFLMLAEDEKKHAEILQNRFNGKSFKLKDNNTLVNARNVFSGIGNFKNEIRETPNQLDLYRSALQKEKESVELYKKMLSGASDEKARALFEFLIGQEEEHFTVLEDLVVLINRPNDWVESAEFNKKEEY